MIIIAIVVLDIELHPVIDIANPVYLTDFNVFYRNKWGNVVEIRVAS